MPASWGQDERRHEGDRGPVGYLALLDDRLPLLKFFGFGFWVAWFGVAYKSSVWVNGVEATASVVSDMFFASTVAHACTLLVMALLYRRVAAFAQRPWFVMGGGFVAAFGCVLVILAGPALVPSLAVFSVGSALTGVGTAALSLNAGLLLCSVRPRRALNLILYCELLAALMQFMVLGLPQPWSAALFVMLPLVSAACFTVGLTKRAVPAVSESQRLAPARAFYRFLVVVGILGVAAKFGQGAYQTVVSPVQLADDGSITAFVTAVCLVAFVIAVALKSQDLNFGHLFYPMALLIIFSLLVPYFFPANASVGVVLAGVAFELFDVLMWYFFSYIVFQSKASAVLVVALGRAVIAFGVTVGNALGTLCATVRVDALPVSTVVFLILFVAAVAVFFLFPEKQVDRLLLPIPDEDEPGASSESPAAGEGSVGMSASGVNADGSDTAVSGIDAGSRRGRWKRACLQLGDEAQLTEREKEVLVLLARGRGSQSISDELTVSLYTTRAHTRNIYAKLDVHSRQELADRVREYAEEDRADAR